VLLQVVELQDELAQLRSKQLADSAQHAAARPTAQGAATAGTAADAGAADAAAAKAAQEHQLLQEQLLNLAADNAHLAVALAETVLSQHQQGAPPAAAAAAADGRSDDGSRQQQRLQLLLSQLVAVKDQVAAAHELSQQQQGVIKTQQQRLLELLQALATLQQEHAAALAAQHEQRHQDRQQQQQQRGSNTWDPVDKAYAASSRQSVKPHSASSSSAGARHGLSQRQGDAPPAAAAALEEVQEENGRLRLAVAEALAAVRQLSVEREVLLEGLVDEAAVQELDAKNRGLLQVRMSAQLHWCLFVLPAAAAAAGTFDSAACMLLTCHGDALHSFPSMHFCMQHWWAGTCLLAVWLLHQIVPCCVVLLSCCLFSGADSAAGRVRQLAVPTGSSKVGPRQPHPPGPGRTHSISDRPRRANSSSSSDIDSRSRCRWAIQQGQQLQSVTTAGDARPASAAAAAQLLRTQLDYGCP
jgi:hypothetical protein